VRLLWEHRGVDKRARSRLSGDDTERLEAIGNCLERRDCLLIDRHQFGILATGDHASDVERDARLLPVEGSIGFGIGAAPRVCPRLAFQIIR